MNAESIRRWLRAGTLSGINLGRGAGWRVRRSDLDRLLEERRTSVASQRPATAPRGSAPIEVEVTCVSKVPLQNPYTGITHIGDGTTTWTQADVIRAIREGTHRFITVSGQRRSEVQIYDGPFAEYLRTRAGDTWDDSLLQLQECDQ